MEGVKKVREERKKNCPGSTWGVKALKCEAWLWCGLLCFLYIYTPSSGLSLEPGCSLENEQGVGKPQSETEWNANLGRLVIRKPSEERKGESWRGKGESGRKDGSCVMVSDTCLTQKSSILSLSLCVWSMLCRLHRIINVRNGHWNKYYYEVMWIHALPQILKTESNAQMR